MVDINNAIMIEEYLEHLLKNGRKESTIVVVKAALNCFIKDGYDFENYEDYISFLEEHTVKKRSYNYYNFLLGFVKYTFSENKEKQRLLLNTIKMFGKKNKDPRPRNSIISDVNQMRIIKNIISPKHQLIAWIQKETGVRAGDVIRTKKEHVRFGLYKDNNGKSTIVLDITFIKKGDKVSKIPIFHPDLINFFKLYLKHVSPEDDYLFAQRDVVNFYNADNDTHVFKRNYNLYYYDLKQACKKCGFEVNQFATHDWRRNFANKVWIDVLKKTDIVALQRALGHEHIDTTTKYLRQSGLESRDIFKHAYELNK